MKSGKLDRRWDILTKSTTTNSFGEEIVTWNTTNTTAPKTVWGSWEPLKGNEKWSAQQVVERAEARIRIRYRSDVTALNRMKNTDLGEFEIIGEPEQYRREGETVMNVSRIVES